jgi:ferritin-like metal-binding protein YciE
MELETLKDLYIHELKDLYSAEKQLIKALPKMAKAASNKQLAESFKLHLEETKEQAARLERILTDLGQSTRGPKCKGMEGVIAEGDEMIKEKADEEVRDAGLIAAAQRVEHKVAAKILPQTLNEEGATDKKLTKLAKSTINIAAKG